MPAIAAAVAAPVLAGALGLRLSKRLKEAARVAAGLGEADAAPSAPDGFTSEMRALSGALACRDGKIRETLDRLADSEARFRGLLETMSEGFVIVDREERMLFANRRLARMLRAPLDSLKGLELTCFVTGRQKERLLRHSKHRLAGRSGRYALELRAADGKRVSTLVSAAPLRDRAGAVIGSFAVITDVTERRRLMRSAARTALLRAVGEMAGGITHDFNNRLTAVLGNAQLLLLKEADPLKIRLLKSIEASALEGAETVRRLHELTRSRPERGPEEIDVNVLTGGVLDLMAYKGRGREHAGAEWTFRREFRASRAVSTCPSELREALVNVLLNAFEAMPEGGVVRVVTEDRADAVEIRVTDAGPGMPESVLKRALDPFFSTRGPRRTGLGLPMACAIVQRHGGRMEIESSPGQGTTVAFRLPATARALPGVVAPARTAAAPPRLCPALPRHPRRARVLVADDEDGVLRLLRLALAPAGHDVTCVHSGVEALDILERGGIDILVTDLGMPGMAGTELAARAREVNPAIRVVLVTGSTDDQGFAGAPGIDVVVRKPFSVPDLVEAVAALLRGPEGQSVVTG